MSEERTYWQQTVTLSNEPSKESLAFIERMWLMMHGEPGSGFMCIIDPDKCDPATDEKTNEP